MSSKLAENNIKLVESKFTSDNEQNVMKVFNVTSCPTPHLVVAWSWWFYSDNSHGKKDLIVQHATVAE